MNFLACYNILKEKVYPDRIKKDVTKYPRMVNEWWKFWMNRKRLNEKIPISRYLYAAARVSKYLNFIPVKNGTVFHEKLVIVLTNESYFQSIIQSSIHNEWCWKYSTTLEGRLNYTPSENFETFPFPQNLTNLYEQQLKNIGERYHEHRKQLLFAMQLGLTKTYNAFHAKEINAALNLTGLGDLSGLTDKKTIEKRYGKEVWNLWNHLNKTEGTCSFEEAIAGIIQLRELHVQMDNAVLEAYGWHAPSPSGRAGVGLLHNFYEVDYLPENDRIRYTIHPDARK